MSVERSRLSFHFLGGTGGDPCLLVDVIGERRAILVDIGEAPALTAGIARRVTDLLVTHTHLDHFSGFSRLVRHVLDQERTIRVFGPSGMADNLAGALAAFTWNYPKTVGICFEVIEWGEAGALRRVSFVGRDSFRPTPLEREAVDDPGRLFVDGMIEARVAILDHGIPVLAFSIEEAPFYNVDMEALSQADLVSGPWLKILKEQAAVAPDQRQENISTSSGERAVSELLHLVQRTPGLKMAYVTDTLFTEQVAERVAKLAGGADIFFCEHMFSGADSELAAIKKHLTTVQVGRLAALAGVKALHPFHFSRRYLDDPEPLVLEAREAWEAARAEE